MFRKSSRDRLSSMLITNSRRSTARRSIRSVKRPSSWSVPHLYLFLTAVSYCRYSKGFTTVIPTLFNVCEYWFNKDANRLRDIRSDTLSQILNLASVRPGGRYLCVDDASGIVVTGILQRLGGQGRLITVCDIESPPAYPCMVQMNFSKEMTSVMSSLNWATADEEYAPITATSEPPTGKFKSEGQKSRLNKRKVASDMLVRNREELFAGEFDG